MSLIHQSNLRKSLLRDIGTGVIKWGIQRGRQYAAKKLGDLARNSTKYVVNKSGQVVKRAGESLRNYAYKRSRSDSSDSGIESDKSMPRRSFSRAGARRRYRRRSTWSSGRLVTTQHDAQSRYRRGRGSRRGSRRGRRFRYRVLQTVNSLQPLSVYTVVQSAQGTTANNAQSYYGVGLFCTKMTGMNDLQNIFTDAGVDLATATNTSSKVVIKSACLDVQARNNGSNDLFLDIYEILCVRDTNSSSTPASLFSTYFAEQTTITAASSTSVAVSVFENPDFCRHFKVLKKSTTMINPGDCVSMQMRYGKDRVISGNTVNDYQGCIPKLSKFYFFMWHGVPVLDGTPKAVISSTDIIFSYQKAYKYAVMAGRSNAQQHNAPALP